VIFILGVRVLLGLLFVIGFIYLVYRYTNRIRTTEDRKDKLNDAINHIQDTINTGEALNKVDIERLQRAQKKINDVINADTNKRF
jgi:predicted  nucleic acid-binding Zn-ribbon protein